jgi:hypothetical protein
MESRIRYKKTNKEGIFYSVRDITSKSTGAKYRVKLNLNDNTYLIYNLKSEKSYHGGEGINNTHVLKRHIKKHLEKLGVEFNTEVRDNSSRIRGKNCSYDGKNNG